MGRPAIPPLPTHIAPAFELSFEVPAADIDGLGHINNVVYLKYFENVGWAHSCDLGLDLAAYRKLDRAMVVHRHELDYLAPGYLGDRLTAQTWITLNDRKLSLCRAFRLVRHRDNTVLAQAITSYTCVSFATSRVKRMPDLFIEQYKVTI